MFNKIKLKFGPKGNVDPLEIEPGSVTVFVGPNNSGKSLLLRELDKFCDSGKQDSFLILEDVELNIADDFVRDTVESCKYEPTLNDKLQPGQVKYGKVNSTKGQRSFQLKVSDLVSWKNSPGNIQHFCNHFLLMFAARFGGKERFSLVDDKANGDLKNRPNSNLLALFQDDTKRQEVRDLLFEAFGKYFVIDPTDMKNLKIRFSDTAPPSTDIERGWSQESVDFHKQAKHISEFSDGVQAFTGLVMAIIVGDEKFIFLDEPEAFLHPSLSNVLGRKLSDIMSHREGHLLVSTHSPSFIMGCIQSGKRVNIVRLTYDGRGNSTARILSSSKLSELFKEPLLRSTGTIEALFFTNVIVTESDTDRALYNEINQRLLHHGDPRGVPNCLFINAQNKQTIWKIIKPLRELGIPSAAIVDIDFIKDGGNEHTKALKAAHVPETLRESFGTLRGTVKRQFEATGSDMKRDGGINLLSGAERESFLKFVNDFQEYGVFIVKNGELESWLNELHNEGHGPSWLIPIFEKLGSDPSDKENYIEPSEGDVWDFFRDIKTWLTDPNKKGID
ncbi:hypothetical protein BIY24_05425 [Halobacteriovorax marinus]|uniref:ATP-dependent nuclease n=1 Tax=Halobacteriovorax marinus TaxID=97084 RepID=UPI000BC334A3|nr:AAA family ATPase [Halobacteriovorax marinus]ATH07398.1 hypothetical protein BIY24_05425 [Halobacteriovorax marinus]